MSTARYIDNKCIKIAIQSGEGKADMPNHRPTPNVTAVCYRALSKPEQAYSRHNLGCRHKQHEKPQGTVGACEAVGSYDKTEDAIKVSSLTGTSPQHLISDVYAPHEIDWQCAKKYALLHHNVLLQKGLRHTVSLSLVRYYINYTNHSTNLGDQMDSGIPL